MSISEFLNRKYTGLYYIGRSGNQLSPQEVDVLAKTMLHLHALIGGPEHDALVEWYTTVGVTIAGPGLVKRLEKCTEVSAIATDAASYIAHALHHPVPKLKFGAIDGALLKRLQQ
jgi:hypothetical protein